jgi:hypothetical protein
MALSAAMNLSSGLPRARKSKRHLSCRCSTMRTIMPLRRVKLLCQRPKTSLLTLNSYWLPRAASVKICRACAIYAVWANIEKQFCHTCFPCKMIWIMPSAKLPPSMLMISRLIMRSGYAPSCTRWWTRRYKQRQLNSQGRLRRPSITGHIWRMSPISADKHLRCGRLPRFSTHVERPMIVNFPSSIRSGQSYSTGPSQPKHHRARYK